MKTMACTGPGAMVPNHMLLYALINISVPEAVQRSRDLPHELHYWLLGDSYSSNW